MTEPIVDIGTRDTAKLRREREDKIQYLIASMSIRAQQLRIHTPERKTEDWQHIRALAKDVVAAITSHLADQKVKKKRQRKKT